ncbi:MAG: hypothetical protein LUC92_01615 [Clostridiales bacterium]|nr:hypothetical protein [Clostridiales bacterium]
MKKSYEKPKLETAVINTEAVASATLLSTVSPKQSEYKTLNIGSKTIVNY